MKYLAEALGTFFLVAVVIGSGIMAENLAQGNNDVALLGNTIATGAILYVIIKMFGHGVIPSFIILLLNLTETTFEIPSCSFVIPYKESEFFIVILL